MIDQKTTPKNSLKTDQAEDPFLGINGRKRVPGVSRGLQAFKISIKTVERIDPETGEISFFQETPKGERPHKTPQQARAERYALKAVVNSIFPQSETAKCCRARRSLDPVTILKSKEYDKAHYSGLVHCHSVWSCPVCSAKIAERRRAELVAATATARSMGFTVQLATFTVPHGMGDDVEVILEQIKHAWRYMTQSTAYRSVYKSLDIIGTVRAIETTYGQNGFHPHFHVLIFLKTFQPSALTQLYFSCLWRTACKKRGLSEPSQDRGVVVKDGEQAASYVSKWGLEDEMTKGHLKTSKGEKGITPWDMLRDVLLTGSESSMRLFAVYSIAFKGSRQLHWSKGLKKLLAIEDFTDEELNVIEDDQAYELAQLTVQQWRAVLFTRSEAALLDLAERDPSKIQNFLSRLVAISSHEVSPC